MGIQIDTGPLGIIEFPDDWSDQQASDYFRSDEFKQIATQAGFAEHYGYADPDLSYGETIAAGLESGTLTSGSALIMDLAAGGALDPEYAASIIGGLQSTKQDITIPASVEEYMQQESLWNTVDTFLQSPIEIGLFLGAEGIGTSEAGLVLGVAGGIAGSAVAPGVGTITGAAFGVGLGSLLVENGATILEEMAVSGVNVTKPDEIAAALRDTAFMTEAARKGLIKGSIVGTIDAASAGLAGKLMAQAIGKSLTKRIVAGAGEVLGIQAGGGMAGEALGSAAIGREVGWPELLAEGIGEGFTGIIETGVGTVYRTAAGPKDKPDTGPVVIEFEGQTYSLEPGKKSTSGVKPGATINLRDDKLGTPAKYGDFDVTYIGRGTYEGKDAALVRLPGGMVGPVAFEDLSFTDEAAIEAETIPEVKTVEDLDKPSVEEATADEEITDTLIPYDQAVTEGIVGPTQSMLESMPLYQRALEKQRMGWPLSADEELSIGEGKPEVIDTLDDSINWLGRKPMRVSQKQINALMERNPNLTPEQAKKAARQTNQAKFNREKKQGKGAVALSQREQNDRANEIAEDHKRREAWGEDYKARVQRAQDLARELSYRGQLHPRAMQQAEPGANRKRPIKKDVATLKEINDKRAEYNELRQSFGMKPVTNWDRVSPKQIERFRFKELGERLSPVSSNPRWSKPIKYGDVFHSKARRAIERTETNKAPGGKWLNILKKAGVTKAEIVWLGLDALDGNQKYTKQDIFELIDLNQVYLSEQVSSTKKEAEEGFEELYNLWIKYATANNFYEGNVDASWGDISVNMSMSMENYTEKQREVVKAFKVAAHEIKKKTPQYSRHGLTLPNGTNYREIVITKQPEARGMRNLLASLGAAIAEPVAEYTSGHWYGVDNPIAHVRFNERVTDDGKRIIFIEEIQSDWLQSGRKFGFRSKAEKPARPTELLNEVELEKIINETTDILLAADDIRFGRLTTNGLGRVPDTWAIEIFLRDVDTERQQIKDQYTNEQLALFDKYQAHYAIESEYLEDLWSWEGLPPDAPFKDTWHELVMRRMIRYAAENNFDAIGWTTGAQQAHRSNFEEGSQGRKGMQQFYDRTLVNFVNKLGKPFNAKHEEGLIKTVEDSAFSDIIHTFDIPLDLKAMALNEGFPLWSKETDTITERIVDDELEAYEIVLGKDETKIEKAYKRLRAHLDKLGLSDIDLKVVSFLEYIDSDGIRQQGKANYYNGLITLVVHNDNQIATLNHEALHALRDMEAFKKAEWKVLEAQAKATWMEDYDIAARYDEDTYRTQLEEAIAHAYGDWISGNSISISPEIETLFTRIAKIIEAIKRAFTGKDAPLNIQEVFEKIKSGEMGRNPDRYFMGLEPSFSEITSNPNDRPLDRRRYEKVVKLPKEARRIKRMTRALKNGEEMAPRDLSRPAQFLSTMRHVAHRSASFAKMMINFEYMREKRMQIANDASILLKPLGRLQKDPEQLDMFNKAAEISQLVPGSYRPDEQGRINFVAPPTAPLGGDSKVVPGEIVVLEGDAAIAYMSTQKVMKEVVLEEMRKGFLANNGDAFLLLQDVGVISPDVEITEEFINEFATFNNLHGALNDISGRIAAIKFNLGDVKLTEEMKKDPAVKQALKDIATLELLESKLLPLREGIKSFTDFTKNDYLPMMRFGSHYLSVNMPGQSKAVHYEQMEFGMFVSRAAKNKRLNARKHELELQYPDSVVTGGPNSLDIMRKNLGDIGISMELAASFLHGKKADMYAQIRTDLEKAHKAKGFKIFFQPRAKTPGYSTDWTRSIAQYVQTMAGAAAQIRYGKSLGNALGELQKSKTADKNLREYAQSAYDYITSPHEEFQNWRRAMFVWYLGGNPASAILQTMSLVQFTGPFLSQFGSTPKVAAEMTRAFNDARKLFSIRTGKNIHDDLFIDFTKLPEDVRDDVMRAVETGIIKQMAVLEEAGISPVHASIGAAAGRRRLVDSVVKWSAIPFNTMESMSRTAAFIAATRLARDPKYNKKIQHVLRNDTLWQEENKGRDEATSYQFAKFVVDETFGLYGKTNRAPYMRKFGAPIFQFQSYIHMMWELMIRLYGNGPEGKKALAGVALMLMLTGGLTSLPGADDAMDLYDELHKQLYGIDPLVRTTMREMIHDTTNGNPFATDMITHGLFNALGYDVQQRISMGNVPGADILRAIMGIQGDAADVLGLPGAVIFDNVSNASLLAGEGRWPEVIQHALPIALRNLYQQMILYPGRLGDGGIRTAQGQQVFTPEQVDNMSYMDKLGKSIGFTPTVISQTRDVAYQQRRLNSNIQLAKERYSEKFSDALYRQYRANRDLDSKGAVAAYKDMQDIMLQILNHNLKSEPHNQITIDLTTMAKRAMMRIHPEQMRDYALSTSSVAKSKALKETY